MAGGWIWLGADALIGQHTGSGDTAGDLRFVTYVDVGTRGVRRASQCFDKGIRICRRGGPIFAPLGATTAICGDLYTVRVRLALGQGLRGRRALVGEATSLIPHKAKCAGLVGDYRGANHNALARIASCFHRRAQAGGLLAVDFIASGVVALALGRSETWAFAAG